MNYIYVPKTEQPHVKAGLTAYAKKLGQDFLKIEEDSSSKEYWSDRKINNILNEMKSGNSLIVYEAFHLGISVSQICDIFNLSARKGVNIHFLKYNKVFKNANGKINTIYLISLMSQIDSDFISKRTTVALAKRKARGLPLGRPKGSANKTYKLDKNKEEIDKYLKLDISKASIAKLVGCHAQTLYDWLDRNKLRQEK